MLYIDYNFDLENNTIIFDEELRLADQINENKWGSLPAAWKDGDLFMLKTNKDGRVILHRKPD